MAQIQFKAKVQTMHNVDNSVAYSYLQVPEFGRKHCDMSAFRSHQKYGAYVTLIYSRACWAESEKKYSAARLSNCTPFPLVCRWILADFWR